MILLSEIVRVGQMEIGDVSSEISPEVRPVCLTLTTSGVPGVPGVGAGERTAPPVSSHHPPVLLTAAAAQPAGPHLVPGEAHHPAVGVHTVQLQSRLSPPVKNINYLLWLR